MDQIEMITTALAPDPILVNEVTLSIQASLAAIGIWEISDQDLHVVALGAIHKVLQHQKAGT